MAHIKTVHGISWQWDYFDTADEANEFLYRKQAGGYRGDCYVVNAVRDEQDKELLGKCCVHWRAYGPDTNPHGPYVTQATSRN